jgi:dephospho-CoA kinase
MDRQDAENRLARQVSDEAREKISDTVFDNSGDMDALNELVEYWLGQVGMQGDICSE